MGVAGVHRSQSFPLGRFLLVLALGSATSTAVLAEPQPEAPQVVDVADTEQPIFEKQVADAQKLVVSRRRVPRVVSRVKEAEVEEWWRKAKPEAKVTWPERNYRYTFTSFTTDGNGEVAKREMWWFEAEQFASGGGRVTMLDVDVAVEGKLLVYVYKQFTSAYAKVVRLDAARDPKTAGLKLDTKRRGYSPSESEVESARIEGSLQEGNLVIPVTVSSGQTLRFLFKTQDGKDKWERQPEPEPKPATPELPADAPAK